MISRRHLITSTISTTVVLGGAPVLANKTSQRDPRLIVVLLRGGMDGLAAVPATGDKHYARARGGLAEQETVDLDGFFALNANLSTFHEMYRAGDLAIVHAVAPPYRERSHFDGQDVLETGVGDPSGSTTGWLYRALAGDPGAAPVETRAMAIGGAVPLILRGERTVASWAPDRLPDADQDTLRRVQQLYADDAVLGPKLAMAYSTEAMMSGQADVRRGQDALRQTASTTAQFLKHPDGPRIAVLDTGGWDTHANQAGQLSTRFTILSDITAALRASLDQIWDDTVIVMATEFGRTVAMNGTRGSDHGIASAAFIAGGAVNGGQVLADWPGLAKNKLFDGRDLAATLDVRSVFKSVLVNHLGHDSGAVDQLVFSDRRVPILDDLFPV